MIKRLERLVNDKQEKTAVSSRFHRIIRLCRIFPDLSGFNLIDFDQVPDLLEAGYRAALPALKLWAEGKQ